MIDVSARQRFQAYQKDKAAQQSLNGIQTSILEAKDYSPILFSLQAQLDDLKSNLSEESRTLIKQILDSFKKSELTIDELKQLQTLNETKQSDLTTEQHQQVKDLLAGLEQKLGTLNQLKAQIDGIKMPTQMEISKLPSVKVENFPKQAPFPTDQKVHGDISVTDLPPVTIANLQELGDLINGLQISTINAMSSLKTVFPKSFEVSNEVKINDWNNLLAHVDELNKGLNILINQEKDTSAKQVEVTNFPIPKIPQPVTNFTMNGLQGFVHTTANVVGTNIVTLPNYGQLFSRRSVQIYNNSTNTIYIGGSDVTVSNGIPVPAGAYSNIIDAGYRMIIYGVASTPNNDIRVLEVSKDQTTNVQE